MKAHTDEVNRILIAGISGAGKTTLAQCLEDRLGLRRCELDALHHGPGWAKRPEFESDVRAFSAAPRWVTEDQYHTALGDLLWERADIVIWLDLPRATVMWRVLRRSLVRALTRRELWNGNRETFRDWADPGHPIRWAWSQYHRKRRQTIERIGRHPHLTVIRCQSARAVRLWRSAHKASAICAGDFGNRHSLRESAGREGDATRVRAQVRQPGQA